MRCRHYGRLESFDSGKTRRSRSHDTLSDSDLSDRGVEREKYYEYPEKTSKKEKVLSGDNNDCSREQSYESRNALSSKDHLHRKRRKYSSDSGGDSSDGIRERRKSRTNRNEVSGLSYDHCDTGKSSNDKHNLRESEHTKSNLQTGQTQSTSDKGHRSSRKKAKLDYPDDENIDARGRWEPDNVDERETQKKRRRKSHGKSWSEHSKESRSSKHKRKTSSRQRNSDEEHKES